MNVGCNDRERILAGENPQEMEALRRHAADCVACHAEMELWDGITAAAPLLQKSWESPELWPRIHQTLAEESQRAPQRSGFWAWLPQARPVMAMLLLVVVSATATWLVVDWKNGGDETVIKLEQGNERRLLTDQRLQEAQKLEREYIASIERLEKLAGPRIEQAATPLMQSYREKLLVLDSAIAELRAQAEQNQYNAHLRREMMSLYQEKQRTLEDVLREDR